MLAERGSVLGIDVGCSPTRRSSAVCRLDWDARTIVWSIKRFRALEPERTDTIAAMAGDALLSAVAIDGPLRSGFDLIGRYRIAERMLTRGMPCRVGKPGQSSTPAGKRLNTNANACALAVRNRCKVASARHASKIDDSAIVEAFPSSFLGVMIAEPAKLNVNRRNRSDAFFQHLTNNGAIFSFIENLLPKRSMQAELSAVNNHDDRAALVCALTALCLSANQFSAVGDQDGWIILPSEHNMQGWAVSALTKNAEAVDPSRSAFYSTSNMI